MHVNAEVHIYNEIEQPTLPYQSKTITHIIYIDNDNDIHLVIVNICARNL